jgi:hypothetical protein
MAINGEKIPLYFPALGDIYEKLKPYAYPLLRVMMGQCSPIHTASALNHHPVATEPINALTMKLDHSVGADQDVPSSNG